MIRPLRNYIVVRPVVREVSKVLEVRNLEKFNRGVIVSIGPKVTDAKVGDFVIYGNGTFLDFPKVTHDGETFQMIQEADIAGVTDGEA